MRPSKAILCVAISLAFASGAALAEGPIDMNQSGSNNFATVDMEWSLSSTIQVIQSGDGNSIGDPNGPVVGWAEFPPEGYAYGITQLNSQNSTAAVTQDGQSNQAWIYQDSLNSVQASVSQSGNQANLANQASINQTSSDSTQAVIDQEGSLNVASFDQNLVYGQSGGNYVSQMGVYNLANVSQVGLSSGGATVSQWGYNNSAQVSQQGSVPDFSGATASVSQVGYDNSASVNQDGYLPLSGASTVVDQQGDGHSASVTQSNGSAMQATVTQGGFDSYGPPDAPPDALPASGGLATIHQHDGDNLTATIQQFSQNNEATITQSGTYNEALTHQHMGTGGTIEITQVGSGLSYDERNIALAHQCVEGTGPTTITQNGAQNFAQTEQMDGGHSVTVAQNGIGNSAQIRQY